MILEWCTNNRVTCFLLFISSLSSFQYGCSGVDLKEQFKYILIYGPKARSEDRKTKKEISSFYLSRENDNLGNEHLKTNLGYTTKWRTSYANERKKIKQKNKMVLFFSFNLLVKTHHEKNYIRKPTSVKKRNFFSFYSQRQRLDKKNSPQLLF